MSYNYSTHVLEQFRTAIKAAGGVSTIGGQKIRMDMGMLEPIVPLSQLIAKSPKFELADNGDILGDWARVLEMGTPEYLHLPYPAVVLEYSFSDVEALAEGRVLIAKRLVLCLEYDTFKDSFFGKQARRYCKDVGLEGSIIMIPIYFMENIWMPYPFAAVVAKDVSKSTCLAYARDGKNYKSQVGYAVFPIGESYGLSMAQDLGVNGAFDTALSDVSEEVFVLLGLTVALSCCNVGMVETPVPDKLNKKRAKSGKLPLYSYKQIVIKPSHGEHASSGRSGSTITGRQSPRLHARRGHIRTLHGGARRVWVSPAMVGRGTKGVVKSSYRVGGAKG